MAKRGAFLAPVLVPVSSCFVNLPHTFVQSFLGGPDIVEAGSTILELSWETIDGYIQRVCIGWMGGIVKNGPLSSDIIEVPTELARCVGIYVHMKTMPQAYVGVHVVDALPIARQVNVEPCTPDDWELIQLHADAIEMEFLQQTCVINDKQVNPIFVNQNTLIRIRASLSNGMKYARLTPASEIIVAPKERPVHREQGLSSDLYFEQSPPLLVQEAFRNELIDEVWVHPESLAMLDGAELFNASINAQNSPIVALWDVKSKSTIDADEKTETLRQQPECYIARLKASYDVVRGHIVLNPGASATLDVGVRDSVFLRVLKPELSLPLVKISVHCEDPNGQFAALAAQVQQAILRWSNSADCSYVVSSGSILCFELDNGKIVVTITEIQYDAEEDLSAVQLKGVPIGALKKYTVLGGSTGYTLSVDQVNVSNAAGPHQQMLAKVRHKVASMRALNLSEFALSCTAKTYSLLKKAVRPVLSLDGSAVRVLLGTKPPGCVLMHGVRGSGKSTLLHTLVHEVQTSKNYISFATFVDCRELRGLKMESVKSRLNMVFENSAKLAPALIALDNLEALVPEEDDSAGAANEQSRRIAELLLVLLNQNCHRMWTTTADLKLSFGRECEIIAGLSSSNQQQARRKLLETMGNAMQSKSVAIVAAARSDTSIHRTLRACGLFDCPIQVSLPDAERRSVLIHEMLRMKVNTANASAKGKKNLWQIDIDPAIDFGLLASMTDGYSLRDLSSATDRTVHQMLKRYAFYQLGDCSGEIRIVQQNDLVEGIRGLRPTALIGVDLLKSKVKWIDVGGLHNVRTVLKDTLELPTRYAKLYDNTPIKLPAGLLLYGPPGCGKTLLASAVANECGLNFISVKGPEVLNKYIGASEQAIRDLFARASSAAPSVLFLDEFDSIAPRRGADNTGVTDRMVNQLLTFLDGVEARKGVYVLAASSRPDMIDPALLRPGRLDKSLYCGQFKVTTFCCKEVGNYTMCWAAAGFPNEDERLDILRAVSKYMELSDEALKYLPEIARATKSSHFSGADLQAIMYSAQLELVHEKLNGNTSNLITKNHLQKSYESAKPSTSEAARLQFERMYASFSKARNSDFAVADANVSANSDSLKLHLAHQRTALA